MKFTITTEWIKLPRETRTIYLDLLQPCIERGGSSTEHRGVLAHFLQTDIPSGRVVYLCHACGNGKCSNPQHLYWGTQYENMVVDQKLLGKGASIWESTVQKYGLEEALARRISKKSRAPLSGKHKKAISKSLKIALNKNKKLKVPEEGVPKRP